VGDAYLLRGGAPIWVGILFAVGIVGLQYLLSPWIIEHCFDITWYEDDIPARLRLYVEQLCRQRGLPMPRMGIIESGTPNAFAFGRLRSDARIVVTRGLLDLLTEEEADAVVAHEVGHIAHYDFALMAVAAMAPLLLYQLYIWTRGNNNTRIVSYAAYISYLAGEFMVLALNRTREYGADHFSACEGHAPNALSSALVKIAYGMVRQNSEVARLAKEGSKDEKKDARKTTQMGRALGLMGIMAASGSSAIALGESSPEDAAKVMRWDLINPWARFYELSSTHPLTALRLRALNREAKTLGQNVVYPLPLDTKVSWVGFPVEFAIWAAPLVCGFLLFSWLWIGRPLQRLGFHFPSHLAPALLVVMGVTWAVRIAFRYHGEFKPKQVEELLEDMAVSQMRTRAVELQGEIVGNGIPGAFWSPDLVLRDKTGLMFVLYRSSIPFGRLWFAVNGVDRFIGEQVNVTGWYRRGLRPYVELSRIEARVSKAQAGSGPVSLFGNQDSSAPLEYEQIVARSYSRWIQMAGSAAATAVGVIWLLGDVLAR
jgi:Zn-dependent protease with chaperone function